MLNRGDELEILSSFTGHDDVVSAVDAVSEEGSACVLSGSWDGSVLLWDLNVNDHRMASFTGPLPLWCLSDHDVHTDNPIAHYAYSGWLVRSLGVGVGRGMEG